MVARGDLAVEYPLEKVPMVQKRLVEMCRRNAKPVIVATQMMESMITNSRPTRAEASDVANAILDGADAVMLSAESSVGAYPIETVKTMSKIVVAAEEELLSKGLQPLVPGKKPRTQGGSVARAACEIADFLGGKALVAFTQSGDTARRLSRYRAAQPILAFTTDEGDPQPARAELGRGVAHRAVGDSTDAMVDLVDQELLKLNRFNEGDTVVITAGSPPGVPGTTNMVRVHHLGGGLRATDRLVRLGSPVRHTEGAPCRAGGALSVLRLPEVCWSVGARTARRPGQSVSTGAGPGTVQVPPNWAACLTFTFVK
jgi:pyruvate kinase